MKKFFEYSNKGEMNMRMYENDTAQYTTEALVNMGVAEITDLPIVTQLVLLGFDYTEFDGNYYFIKTPKLEQVLTLIVNS